MQGVEPDLEPGVLVAADDDAGPVGVEEQHDRVRVRLLQEVVLKGQVEVGVMAARDVDLDPVGRVRDGLGGEEAPVH